MADTAEARRAAWELVEASDAVIVDIDGVVCVGDSPVDGAGAALERILAVAGQVVFATNDSRRDHSGQRSRVGRVLPNGMLPRIVTAPEVIIRELLLRDHRHVCVWGAPALHCALVDAGLYLDDGRATAVVTGAPGPGWTSTQAPPAGCVALLDGGAEWLATNPDPFVPSPSGPLPDGGALIDRLHQVTGRDPEVCGKPYAPMLSLVRELLGDAANVVVIGDRADTDVAWAQLAGWRSILVGDGPSGDADVWLPALASLAGDTLSDGGHHAP